MLGEDDRLKDEKAEYINHPYQLKECIMYGSLFEKHMADFENRLAGICDPGCTDFNEHEMNFSLRTQNPYDSDVTLRLRRKFNSDPSSSNQWRFRYIGRPEPDPTSPALVRKVVDSVAHSYNMMEFVKNLGLRMDYEFIAKGKVWTCSNIKVVVSSIRKTRNPGVYDPSTLEKISESYQVEISVTIPDSVDYQPHAKMLKSFADQLFPLVEMQKCDTMFSASRSMDHRAPRV